MAAVFAHTGKAITTNRLKGAGTEPNYVAWGTGAGVASAADTGLFAEGPEARVAGTSTQQTTNVGNDTYQVVATITAAAARNVTNAGLFDALSSGSLFIKSDFAAMGLAAGDAIQFTMKLTYS
jgi:hypothetical protein